MHTLLTALRLAADRPAVEADTAASIVGKDARKWLSHIPELSYLSHIVFRLWEDPGREDDDPQRHMVELSFSPGIKFDCPLLANLASSPPKRLPKPPLTFDSQDHANQSVNDFSSHSSDGYSEDKNDHESQPTQRLAHFASTPCRVKA